jgi:hypothetical protein
MQMKNFNSLILLVLVFVLASCSQSTTPTLETQTYYPNSSNIRMKTADWNYGRWAGHGEVFNLNTYGTEFPYELQVWAREPGKTWRLILSETISDRAAEIERNRMDDFLFARDPYLVLERGSRFWANLISRRDQHTRCMQNNIRKAC